MPPRRRHRLPGQARAAPAARRWRAVIALIRVIGQIHRHPGITRLLTRPPLPLLPQRPIRAPLLLLVRAIGGRRARGCGRVLARPPLKLIDPRRKPLVQLGQPLDLPGQLSGQPVRPRQPHRQPGGRQRGQLLSRGRPGTADTTGNDHHSSPPINNAPRRVTRRRHDCPGGPAPRCDRALRSLTQWAGLACSSAGHRGGAPVPGGHAWRSLTCEEDASTS